MVAPRKSRKKECDCAKQVNDLLKDKNAELDLCPMMSREPISFSMSPPSVKLRKRESGKRGSLPNLFCSYCPFCGKKID